MCKPDSKLPNDSGYRLESRIYSITEALSYLKTSLGFNDVDAQEYLNSLKEEVVKCGLLQAERIKVIGAGSSKGVNLEQFRPCEKTKTDAAKIRRDLGINDNEVVIGYVGRLTEEKGITELLTAFCNIRKTNNAVHILLVGDQDQRAPLPAKAIELMAKTNSVHMVSFNDNIIPFIAAMDVLVLASYREGFGNVLIEASAMEKPVIGTDIIGCRDAVVDGTTGILVKPHNPVSLEKALITLIENPAKRTEMGRNGRQWVKENFDRNLIWDGLIKVYQQTLRRVKKK
jgi:glycosyltransferase involved in cell wall biosynthesis